MAIETVAITITWVLSATCLWHKWLAGSMWRYCWLLGLVNQALWLTWIVLTNNWGLMPMTLVITAVTVRNHFKWMKELGKPVKA